MNKLEDAVRRMGISSISEDFVSPYTFAERDYFACEYALPGGGLLDAKGGLLAPFGMAMPVQLSQLEGMLESWPVAEEHRASAVHFFTSLTAQAADSAPSLFEMLVSGGDGQSWICVSSAVVSSEDGQRLQLRFMRVDNEKRELARLMDRSETDPLTHALNRTGLRRVIRELVALKTPWAFVMLDIDGFRAFNDRYGHLAGDALLTEVADRLAEGLAPHDLIARLGGDDFIICLRDISGEDAIQRAVDHVQLAVQGGPGKQAQLTVSMGVSLSPRHGVTFEELYRKADVALCCAKRRGGNHYLIYEPDMVMPAQEEPAAPEENAVQETGRTHLMIRCIDGGLRFVYPPEAGEWFRASFDQRDLWQVLREDGVARSDTVRRLQESLAQLGAGGIHFSEYLLKAANGMWRWYRIGLIRDGGDTLMVLTDVNDELRASRQGTQYDELTGLLSHSAFVRKAEQIISGDPEGVAAGRYAIVYFDIVRFKAINDRFGVSEGDRLLMYIANGVSSVIKPGEIACRIGSDQFALLLGRSREEMDAFTEVYQKGISDYDLSFEIVSNMGIYITTGEALSIDAMLDRAILAQASIKGSYVTRINYYSEEMRSAMLGEQEIVGMMNTALAERQFVVYYQPQYDHSNGELIGAEALVRWLHPEHGLISPGVFIPIFEKNGFITRLDFFVFDQVCRFQRKCLDEGRMLVPISVNLTRYDIYQPDFVEKLEGIRLQYNVPVELVCVEITETAVVGDNRHASQVIAQLHQKGYVVEMDDFGSGYSSLNVLKDIDLDILKLDMRFLTTAMSTGRSGTILSSVVRMAKWLRLPVIAEGVESMQQADYLKSIGCNYIQGFLYARPMPEADFATLLNRSTIGEAMPAMRLIETLNADNFWNPDSQETLIFSNFVGGATIFDYREGQVEILRVNAKYLQEIGGHISEQQLIARDPLTLFDEANRQIYIDMLDRAIASGEEEECETWRNYSDCQCGRICIRSSVRVIGRSKDSFLFYEMIRNITAEKDALAEIAHRESLFRAASEQVNIYYWEYDVATREMRPCFRCKRDLGLPELVVNYPEPAIEMGIFPPEVADQYREMHRQIEAGAAMLEADLPLTPERVMFKVRYTTEFDKDGNPVRAYGSAIPL